MPLIIPIETKQIITPQTTPAFKEVIKKAEEVPSTEATPAIKQETKPEDKITAETSPQDAMRIAASIRREKALQKKSKELELEREAIMRERAELQQWREASELSKTDKIAALKRIGISYEDVTNQILNNGAMPPETIALHTAEQTAREIIEKRLAEFEKKQSESLQKQQQDNYEQSIKQIDSEVKGLVDSSDKFSLVKESEAYHDVTEYIESEFHRIGIILPIEVAAEKVEQEIVEGILNLAKLDKIKSKLLPQEEEKIEAAAPPNPKTITLTNKTTATPPSVPKKRTEAERRQRAIDILNGIAV